MSDLQNEKSQESSSKINTPAKRTPSKRLTKAHLESVAVIKSMGGSLDVEGGRRTRSSVRGNLAPTTPVTPPPIKKLRQSTSRRGRPKKIQADESEDKVDENSTDEMKETPKKVDDDTKEDDSTVQKPVGEITTTTKSEKLKETIDTGNVKLISKKYEDTITPVPVTPNVSATEKFTEKSEVDTSALATTTHENHIETKKQENINVPDVVTITTQEIQKSINVPEIKIDPVEPMEVDSPLKPRKRQSDTEESFVSDCGEHKVIHSSISTTNNCTADKDLIENNFNKTTEEVVKVDIVETKNNNEILTEEKIINKTVVESNNIVHDKLNSETSVIIPQNDKKINSIVENDKQQESLNENKITSELEDKKGNDSCEPKISTPSPSDGVVQPQTCN